MPKNKKIKIGIIGYGKFGSLIAEILSKSFENIFVFSKKREKNDSIKFFSQISRISECDIIIPAVPIPAFEATLKKINPFLKKGAVLADVCSVKIIPAKLMKKLIKKEVNLLATHPMWGPDSFKANNSSLKDLKIVLYPLRIPKNKYSNIKAFLKKLNLKIIEMTPEKHDKQAADSQVLAQFVGKILQKFPAKKIEISTLGYEKLKSLMPFVINNTDELFYSMQNFNPYSKKAREKFISTAKKINNEINEK